MKIFMNLSVVIAVVMVILLRDFEPRDMTVFTALDYLLILDVQFTCEGSE